MRLNCDVETGYECSGGDLYNSDTCIEIVREMDSIMVTMNVMMET